MSIRRKYRASRFERLHVAKRSTRLGIYGQAVEDIRLPFLFREEQVLAITCPGLRDVRCILWRCGQALRLTYTVCALRKDSPISVPVGLKCNTQPVRRPHRISVSPLERQPPNRFSFVKVVDPDVGFLTVIDADSETSTVRRHPGMHIVSGRQLE